nr:N-acetylmuramoyl-L-alanine amidase [Tamaricihabitans halophyticus]
MGLGVNASAYAEDPGAGDQERQRAFADAAKEFDVPQQVLLGVSYLQSRWDGNAGEPSTTAGYGPMHLTDIDSAGGTNHHDHGSDDPRGDTARPALRLNADPVAVPDRPALHTLTRAAELTGISEDELRADPAQNIRGGAALLAEYQRELGVAGDDPADWYGAVAKYSGSPEQGAAAAFADEVFTVLDEGMQRRTDDGQQVRLTALSDVVPAKRQLDRLDLQLSTNEDVECPSGISCESIPAPYEELPDGGYGNHDKADRPNDQDIDYIIIHDTEGPWESTLDLVQDPTYVSWHYTLRSADGHIAQHVPTKDVPWHASNWYTNAKSIGLEHEGYAAKGTWYTEAMYRTSAKLVGYLADRYDVPLDRAHILGHDNVPGPTPDNVAGMHWDPGPYWDWSHYFELLGADNLGAQEATVDAESGLVTINPDFEANQPAFVGCEEGKPEEKCPARGSSAVVLYSEPSTDSELLTDVGLRPDGSPSTMQVSDIGSRVSTGQQYAVADRQGDWTAIWYLGQLGWFQNPEDAPTAEPAAGMVVTPKDGADSVPVYGRAFPEAEAYPEGVTPEEIVPLQYSLPAGQQYALVGEPDTEYYAATTFDTEDNVVVRGDTKYLAVQFGYRLAYVQLDDVNVLPANT